MTIFRRSLLPLSLCVCVMALGACKEDRADKAAITPVVTTKEVMTQRVEEKWAFACGEDMIAFTPFGDDQGNMQRANVSYAMKLAIAASGARYTNLGDESTVFWNKGDRAYVTIDGEDLPECQLVAKGRDADKAMEKHRMKDIFTARGNEPGWNFTVNKDDFSLVTNYGELTIEGKVSSDRDNNGKRIIAAEQGDDMIEATITHAPCADDMSGEGFSHQVTLRLNDQTYRGCGGEGGKFEDGVRGVEWRLEDMNKAGIIDRSHITLLLDGEGRVSGSSGCNRYMSRYTIERHALSIAPDIAGTMMACAPSLMEQERKYLDLVGKITAFTIDDTGALILSTDDGKTLTYRR